MKVNIIFADGSEVEHELDKGGDYGIAVKKLLVNKILVDEKSGNIFNLDFFVRIEPVEQNKK